MYRAHEPTTTWSVKIVSAGVSGTSGHAPCCFTAASLETDRSSCCRTSRTVAGSPQLCRCLGSICRTL